MSDMYLVPAERPHVLKVARLRHASARNASRRDLYGAAGSDDAAGLAKHVTGAAGELAVAKYTGLHWPASVNSFHKPDVPPYHVRTRTRDDYELIIRPDDPDGPFVLVIERPDWHYRIVGFIEAREARCHREWWQDHGGYGRALFVPQSALMPLLRREAV